MLILFILLAPFSGSNYILFINILIVPFILLHWYLNNNTCCLTSLEHYFRKNSYNDNNSNEGFMNELITPVYDFKKNNMDFEKIIYIIAYISFIISAGHLYYNYKNGKLNSFMELYDF
jgi:hypothetical protein